MKQGDKKENTNKENAGFLNKTVPIAQWIIALLAIAGFILSVHTSQKVSDTLNDIKTTFLYPVISIKQIDLIGNKIKNSTEVLTCDAPPHTLKITYYNSWIMPIVVSKVDMKVYYGLQELPVITRLGFQNEGKGGFTLMPGQTYNYNYILPEDVIKKLGIAKDKNAPPFLSFTFTAICSKIDGGAQTRFFTKRIIKYDCSTTHESIPYEIDEEKMEFVKK